MLDEAAQTTLIIIIIGASKEITLCAGAHVWGRRYHLIHTTPNKLIGEEFWY